MEIEMRARWVQWDDARYFADCEYVSASMLKLYREDRDEYIKRYVTNESKGRSSRAMAIGTALHQWVLEGVEPVSSWTCSYDPRNPDHIGVGGPYGPACPTDLRGARKFAQEHNLPGMVLNGKEGTAVQAMHDALRSSHEATDLLHAAVRREEVVLWAEEVDGHIIPCKAKVDMVCEIDGETILVDLKTSRHPTMLGFAHSGAEYGYAYQAAHYLAGLRATGVAARRAIFLVVCNKAPYSVFPFEFTDEELDYARRTNLVGLGALAEDRMMGWSL
ncbi:MAG: hypothetical protein B7733_05710 [Myxococcales bacterium FL481]|nr:MAG: hypothetical protein B7733_05710 [Myxococcales bacterium FL481]